MKKTIIINIGNTMMHIEEDAYETLTIYLNEIKQHFVKNADDVEIVTDIENRLAEMLNEKLGNRLAKAITQEDVEAVMSQMGRVQDFGTEEEQFEQPEENYQGAKKLYRDADDQMIAGVCAGLSHYLHIDARWLRVLFLLSVFLGGAGFLIYIIFWIAIPPALSRSERMEMRGESTNLYGYKRHFEEELAAYQASMESGHAFKVPLRRNNFFQELFAAIGRVINLLFKVLSKSLAGIIAIAGFFILVGLIVSLAAFLGFWDTEAYQYFPLSIVNENFRSILAFALFLVLFIPVLALVMYALRVTFHTLKINKLFSFGLLIVWLAAVSVGVYYAARISSEFKEHAELEQTNALKSFPVYVLNMDKNMVFNRKDSIDYALQAGAERTIIDDTDNHPFRVPRNVYIQIEKSESGKPSLTANYEAQGKTFQEALVQAKNIDYKFNQADNVLTFSPRLSLTHHAIWRNQEVHLTLKLPVGTRLKISDRLYDYLYFYYHHCVTDDAAPYSEYKEWIMTEEGLKCKAELDKPQDVVPN